METVQHPKGKIHLVRVPSHSTSLRAMPRSSNVSVARHNLGGMQALKYLMVLSRLNNSRTSRVHNNHNSLCRTIRLLRTASQQLLPEGLVSRNSNQKPAKLQHRGNNRQGLWLGSQQPLQQEWTLQLQPLQLESNLHLESPQFPRPPKWLHHL